MSPLINLTDICEVQALDERTGMMVAPGFPSYTASVTGTDCTMTVTATAQSDIILWYQVDMEVGAQVEVRLYLGYIGHSKVMRGLFY